MKPHHLAPVVAVLLLLVPFSAGFLAPAAPMDEGMLLVYPELLLKGNLPYRDFETFYGPANISVLAVAYSIFGESVNTARAVGLIYRLLVLAAIFLLTRKWGATIATGSLLLAGFLLVSTGVVPYAWMGGLACALWAFRMAERSDSTRHCFFAGVLVGAALLYRVDLGPALIVAWLPLWFRMPAAGKWSYLGGGGTALLPLALLTLAAGPRQTFNNLFLFPVMFCNHGRHLPFASVETAAFLVFAAHLGASLVNLAAGVAALRRPAAERSWLPLSLALFCLLLTPQATQRLDEIHALFVSACSVALLPASLAILFSRRDTIPEWKTSVVMVLGVVAVIEALIPTQIISFRRALFAAILHHRPAYVEFSGRSIPVDSPKTAQTLTEALSVLQRHSGPGERLFVGPTDLRTTDYNDTYVYFLLPQLQPASYFLEMNPFSANRPNSRLAADIQSADWLLLDRQWDTADDARPTKSYGSDEPNTVVRTLFDRIGEYGDYVVLRRRDPVSRDR